MLCYYKNSNRILGKPSVALWEEGRISPCPAPQFPVSPAWQGLALLGWRRCGGRIKSARWQPSAAVPAAEGCGRGSGTDVRPVPRDFAIPRIAIPKILPKDCAISIAGLWAYMERCKHHGRKPSEGDLPYLA